MKTLALCVIVGNEEKVIERFLRSFAPITETFCLVRAVGSAVPDETLAVASAVCRDLGKAMLIGFYENSDTLPHVDNFGKARQKSWDIGAKTEHDWLMWADCDDTLSTESAKLIAEELEFSDKDILLVPYEVRGNKQIVLRERIVRNGGFSSWNYAIHETIGFHRTVTYRALHKAPMVHAPLLDRPTNLGRNNAILMGRVHDAARNFVHLHISAFDTNDAANASKWGLAALHAPGIESEDRYEVLLNMAQLGRTADTSRAYAAEAFELLPDRREALALLVNFDLVDKDFYRAEKRARLLMGIPKPSRSYWRLNHEWYEWKGLYLYSYALRRNGNGAEANAVEQKHLGEFPTFSVIHPTYQRAEQALAVRELWLSAADNPMEVEYIFGLHHDDKESQDLLSGYRHTITDKEGCCPNTLTPMRASRGCFVMVIADDLFPCQGWDTKLRAKLDHHWFEPHVVNFNDTNRTDGHMCHAWMTRTYAEKVLADPWPGTGIFSDNEFTHRARKIPGCVIEAPELVFPHMSATLGKAPKDATWADMNQLTNYTEGLRLLKERNPDVNT